MYHDYIINNIILALNYSEVFTDVQLLFLSPIISYFTSNWIIHIVDIYII